MKYKLNEEEMKAVDMAFECMATQDPEAVKFYLPYLRTLGRLLEVSHEEFYQMTDNHLDEDCQAIVEGLDFTDLLHYQQERA